VLTFAGDKKSFSGGKKVNYPPDNSKKNRFTTYLINYNQNIQHERKQGCPGNVSAYGF
jgi:hypothetical protein